MNTELRKFYENISDTPVIPTDEVDQMRKEMDELEELDPELAGMIYDVLVMIEDIQEYVEDRLEDDL
jgi:hypothetical protein